MNSTKNFSATDAQIESAAKTSRLPKIINAVELRMFVDALFDIVCHDKKDDHSGNPVHQADYYISRQHGALLASDTDESNPAYKWVPVVELSKISPQPSTGDWPDWGVDSQGKCALRCFDFPNCKCTGLEP